MNKSFVYGVIIASLTWTVSIYLYWTITGENEGYNTQRSRSFTSVANSEYHKGVEGGRNANSIDNNNDSFKSKYKKNSFNKNKIIIKNQLFEEKVSRYKKEQKYRKFSQKLIDEMKPLSVDKNSTGNLF